MVTSQHHWRTIIPAAIAAVAIVSIALVSVLAQVKTVTVIDAGVARSVTTVAGSVEEVLRNQNIDLGEHDTVTPRSDAAVNDDSTITVTRSQPVVIQRGEQTWTVWVSGQTLQQQLGSLPKGDAGGFGSATGDVNSSIFMMADRSAYQPVAAQNSSLIIIHDNQTTTIPAGAYDDLTSIIKRAGIALNPLDTLAVARGENNSVVARIQRVIRRNVTRTEQISFEKKEVKDDSMVKGQSAITTEGQPGERTIVEFQETVDGKITHKYLVSNRVTEKPVTEVKTIGTKEPEKATKSLAKQAGATTADRPAAPVNPSGAQAIAQSMLGSMGWGNDQFGCLVNLWDRESGWNPNLMNRSSGAYGIPQALPGSKMASAGADWQTNPATQIRWGLGYIAGRYGTPCGAWGHFLSHNWY